ncbi:hypothetical protein [Pontibacillus yanchengensis]|uniref:hypothetical protein n=1 Tax=Pontibacillus yanchengensis TaxID=462910 RepID=UPI000B1BA36B|nr:hypothetical protein [Pontibacillus yanchengensis]
MNMFTTFADAVQLELFDNVEDANKWLKSNPKKEVMDVQINSSTDKILVIYKDL